MLILRGRQDFAKTPLSAGFPVHVAEEHMKSLVTSIVASPKSRNLAKPAVELFLRLSARKDKRHHTSSDNKHAADARDRYGLLALCRNVDRIRMDDLFPGAVLDARRNA